MQPADPVDALTPTMSSLPAEIARYANVTGVESSDISEVADGATKVDKMGQPLKGRSNYDAVAQLGRIWSAAGKDSFGTTVSKLSDWATYTVPDAEQRALEIRAQYGNDPRFAQLDQMRESPLGAIGWLAAKTTGASPEAQQMWLRIPLNVTACTAERDRRG